MAPAFHAQHPRYAAWCGARWWAVPGMYFPDAVTDSTARRMVAARRRHPTMRRLRRAAIRRGLSGRLVMLTLPLPSAHGLYSAQARACGVGAVRAAVGDLPACWKREAGRQAGLHVHVICPAEVGVPDGIHSVPVKFLRGMTCYLAKPGDALAATAQHRRHVPIEDLLTASEAYLTARALRLAEDFARLPTLSGTVNLPHEPPPLPCHLLRLRLAVACARAVLAYRDELLTARTRAHCLRAAQLAQVQAARRLRRAGLTAHAANLSRHSARPRTPRPLHGPHSAAPGPRHQTGPP